MRSAILGHVTDASDELAVLVARGADRLAIPPDASLVLAISGGADSMALLHGAARVARSGDGAWRLRVAHLDHGLREDSADDARFVGEVARELGLPCEIRRVDVATLARTEGRSVEEAGRDARYLLLEEIAAPGDLVATAHTADDAAETVLINLLRGSGLAGARGIPGRRGRIVRPLIGERRATVRALLDAGEHPYRDDPSNADPAFLRNRVRAELLPLMEELRDGAVERIARFSRLAGDDDALLAELATAELRVRRSDDGEIDWHDPPPRALGRRVLRMAIGHPTPSAERLEALLDAAEGERGGVTLELGAGRAGSVRARRIRIG